MMFVSASTVIALAKKQLESNQCDHENKEQKLEALDFAVEAIEHGARHGYQTDDLRARVIAAFQHIPSPELARHEDRNAILEHEKRQMNLIIAECLAFYEDYKDKIKITPHEEDTKPIRHPVLTPAT